MRSSIASTLAVLALITAPAAAHSWIERMMVVNPQNNFTGDPGFARNNTQRGTPGFNDPVMVHILPAAGQPAIELRDLTRRDGNSDYDTAGIFPSDPMCKKAQQTQFQTPGSPRLKAAPGDLVALLYQENGHVTLPQNQKGKPPNRGDVYIYGTTQPNINPPEKFLDVYQKWNGIGSGGDKRGKLLQLQSYDDGRCYQVNSGPISSSRQKTYPHPADKLTGMDLWCQNIIQIPKDAPVGKPYTLYWVWDWPTEPGKDPSLPKGKAEIYTTCMDVDITGSKSTRNLDKNLANPEETDVLKERQAPPASGQNINNMAIPSLVAMAQNGPPAASGAPNPPAAAPAPAPKAAPPAGAPNPAPPAAPQPAAPIASAVQPDTSLAAMIAADVAQIIASKYPSLQGPQPSTPAAPAAAAPASQISNPSAPQGAQPQSQAPQSPPSMPPKSIMLAPPIVNGPPAGVPSAASPAKIGTFTGTAMPAATNAAAGYAPAKRGCSAKSACKKMAKRSRILLRE